MCADLVAVVVVEAAYYQTLQSVFGTPATNCLCFLLSLSELTAALTETASENLGAAAATAGLCSAPATYAFSSPAAEATCCLFATLKLAATDVPDCKKISELVLC